MWGYSHSVLTQTFWLVKVDILKKEAERQQTKREALESELHSLKSHMHTIETVDDVKRFAIIILIAISE